MLASSDVQHVDQDVMGASAGQETSAHPHTARDAHAMSTAYYMSSALGSHMKMRG